MPTGIRALVVVLVIALSVFAVAKPICLRYMDESSFHRRRNVWLVLTVLAFLSPSFWLFEAIAVPLMYFAAKRDDNPLAFYALMLFAVPNTYIDIPPIGGVGQIVVLSHTRTLAIAVLLPAIFYRRDLQPVRSGALTSMDWAVALYCLLQIALFAPYESTTNTLRRSLLLFLDTFIVFYAFARIRPTRQALMEVVLSLALCLGLLASMAIFESLRGWLLYQTIPAAWGAAGLGYLQRGEALRAQVTAGHSLTLGYLMSLGIGFWLFFQAQQARSLLTNLIAAVFWAALLVSYSRGAWLSALLLVIIYLALRPGSGGLLTKVLPVVAVVGVIVYLSPLKEAVIDRLPFIGNSDQETVDYRRRLFEVSWQLIKIHPFLGDPFVTNQLEDLRQGEGIIDLINAYVAVALFYGFIGLTLFVTPFSIVLWRCYAAMRSWVTQDLQMTLLGAALTACMLASLFFIATAGVGGIQYLLAGLLASYARIVVRKTAPAGAGAGRGMTFVRARF